MALKLGTSQQAPERPSRQEELTGPWGRIKAAPGAWDVVRFCQGQHPQKTHSYPYRVISSWHWIDSGPEQELKIVASTDLVTIKGQRLDRIVEALDQGLLEILRETPGVLSSEEIDIRISTITVSQ